MVRVDYWREQAVMLERRAGDERMTGYDRTAVLEGAKALRLVADVLEEEADERTLAACDRCEQCGPMVMCSFHSVLSLLDGGTWTTQAVARGRR